MNEASPVVLSLVQRAPHPKERAAEDSKCVRRYEPAVLKHTDKGGFDLVSVRRMPALDPDPARGASGADEGNPVEVGSGLHQLALRYWSEGRPEDAARVGLEAAKVLRMAAPGSPLLAEVTSTLTALASELRSGGMGEPVLSEVEEFVANLSYRRTEGPGEAQTSP
jgi:hypothetical protein